MAKAINIQWDVDYDDELNDLPTEIDIPEYIDPEDNDAVADYISNVTGYCHFGFDILEE